MNIFCSLLMLCVFIPLGHAESALPSPPLEQLPILNALDSSVLAKGADEMKKHKVVFAGITRNNAPDLAITIKTIEYIGSFFSDYRVIIFENDSDDGTKQILANWKMNNPRINIISENYSIQKRPSNKFLAA
ncbi:MAG: glycosyltransferase family 2 protein, partial [Pseudomonadota bacterium]|nr:glycosyltransferase family 2 protein [Pseudomonadota bacterium]